MLYWLRSDFWLPKLQFLTDGRRLRSLKRLWETGKVEEQGYLIAPALLFEE